MDDKTVIRFPNDNTVIRPKPGGKRQDRTQINFRNTQSVTPQSASSSFYSQTPENIMADYHPMSNSENHREYRGEYKDKILSHTGLNELVRCASTLLSLMIKLSYLVMHNDVAQLKYKLQDEIKQFEINTGQAGIANDKILQARYVICTSLDEIVSSTPWGQESDWSQQSLLSLFHGETWGGEKFYLLLERLLKEPAKNLDILELMYICISLGFQGKYRVIDNGHGQVEHLREELYRQLRSLRHDFNKELSCHWRGISDRRGALIRYVPLWVVAALSGVILLAMFSSFTYMLDQSSTPVINEIIKLGPNDALQAEDFFQQEAEESLQQEDDDLSPERFVKPPQRISQPSDTNLTINRKQNNYLSHSISRQHLSLWRIV